MDVHAFYGNTLNRKFTENSGGTAVTEMVTAGISEGGFVALLRKTANTSVLAVVGGAADEGTRIGKFELELPLTRGTPFPR